MEATFCEPGHLILASTLFPLSCKGGSLIWSLKWHQHMGTELTCLFKGASFSWSGAGAKGPPGSSETQTLWGLWGALDDRMGVQHGLLNGGKGTDAQS